MDVDCLASCRVTNISGKDNCCIENAGKIHVFSSSSLSSLIFLRSKKDQFDLFTFTQQLFMFLSAHFNFVIRMLGSQSFLPQTFGKER